MGQRRMFVKGWSLSWYTSILRKAGVKLLIIYGRETRQRNKVKVCRAGVENLSPRLVSRPLLLSESKAILRQVEYLQDCQVRFPSCCRHLFRDVDTHDQAGKHTKFTSGMRLHTSVSNWSVFFFHKFVWAYIKVLGLKLDLPRHSTIVTWHRRAQPTTSMKASRPEPPN